MKPRARVRRGWRDRTIGAALVGLVVVAPASLAAQLALELAAGARYSTALVRDSIVTPFTVRPALGPALALRATTPLEHGWTARAGVDVSTARFARHDADGSSVDLGRVSTITLTVGLERAVVGRLSAAVEVGGIRYLPGENTGIFRSGAGAIGAVGAVTLAYPLPLARPRRFALEARYDISGFTTPALEDEGVSGARTVHRLTLALVARVAGR